MLDIQVTIEGDKVVIEGLQKLGSKVNRSVRRGLEKIGLGIYDEAFGYLKGPGATYETRVSKKTGKEYRKKIKDLPAGGYPVPVRKGWLLRMLNWLKPGETKTRGGLTYTAMINETVVYDAAEYSDVIHEGKGSSEKYGPRRFLTDALKRFNRGFDNRIQGTIEEEIQKDLDD